MLELMIELLLELLFCLSVDELELVDDDDRERGRCNGRVVGHLRKGEKIIFRFGIGLL